MEQPINIPQEVRGKIQALYWGQEVLITGDKADPVCVNANWMFSHKSKNWPLLLTQLHLISDEDAEQVYKMLGISVDFDCISAQDLKESIVFGGFMEILMRDGYGRIVEIIDFLRSKSYAIEAFDYTVEQLVQAGVFTLKTPEDGKPTTN